MARGKVSDILLQLAAEAADGCVDIINGFIDPSGSVRGKYDNRKRIAEEFSSKSIKNATYRLKTLGCLERIEKKGRTTYKITEKGRNCLEKFLFDKETWDGKWRIVIFDIPEEKKKLREMLRRTLKNSGFKQLQRSVWVSPFDVLDEMEQLVEDHDLHDCLWYFWSNSMRNDDTIIERFLENGED